MRSLYVVGLVLGFSVVGLACTSLLGDFTLSTNGTGVGAEGGHTGPCTTDEKTCGGLCVSKSDPVVGCATTGCSPCEATVNAAPSCKAGVCSFACNEGFNDCDGDPKNGCEGKTSNDVNNCGACGATCGAVNTDAPSRCEQSACVFTCKANFAHCAGDVAGGCETNTSNSGDHCGACGHSCLGGTCTAGKCQPFQLASASVPDGLAVDKTHVYFTFPSVPAIQRVQRDGKCAPASPCPQAFAGQGIDALTLVRGPAAIVSDGTNVWWTNQANGTIVRRSTTLPPGPITILGAARSTDAGYLALVAGVPFWTNGFGNVDPAPHVNSPNPDGGVALVTANFAAPVSTFAGYGGIATDGTSIFWASQNSGVFHAAPGAAACTEGTSCVAYGSASSAYGVAVDDTYVYWTEPDGGAVRRAAKTGGQSTVIATGQGGPKAIAVLGGFVYWGNTTATAPGIRRTPLVAAQCDGTACELVAAATLPAAIVAADDGIYWTDDVAAGGVYRLAK